MDKSLSKLWEMWKIGKSGLLTFMGSQSQHNLATEQQQHWKSKDTEYWNDNDPSCCRFIAMVTSFLPTLFST